MTMVAGSGMSTFVQASYSHIPKCKPKKRMKPIGLEQFVQVKIMSVCIYICFLGDRRILASYLAPRWRSMSRRAGSGGIRM